MEQPTSPYSNQTTASATTAASSTTAADGQSYVSPLQYYPDEDIATEFSTSMSNSFSPLPHSLSLTPSSCSSSDDAIATEYRLNQARLVLEYQQICDHYDLCFARLQALIAEVETLRRENNDLRLANTELIKLLSLASSSPSPPQAAMITKRNLQREEVSDSNVKRWERKNGNWLPKSVSVRSSNYLKVKQQQGSGNNHYRLLNPSLRVYVASEAKAKEARELEVFNQGMVKTELCNKWEETGTCPYGNHCQFAHGINELRPVIRHPRYKTQVCRMVLAGQPCPYGHRCHFRHTLTDQERRLLIPR